MSQAQAPRSMLIVDAGYLTAASPVRTDPLKLRRLIDDHVGVGGISEAHWFDGVPNPVPEGLIKFQSWLKVALPYGPQFRLSLHPLKPVSTRCDSCGHVHERMIQKGVDVGIATLMVKAASLGLCQSIHLVAGDGDFKEAMTYVQESRRVDVVLYAFQGSASPDLQCWSNRVVWLDDYIAKIAKD